MAKITFHYLIKGFRIQSSKKVALWLEQAIAKEKKQLGEISIILCSDAYLLEINNQYLKHNYFTDIITFDYSENQIVSGDLMISLDRVKENAFNYKVTTQQELLRVMIHGVLHLCGYKDKSASDKKRMTQKENYYLKKFINE